MLYHLLYPLADAFSIFNLFQYITVRAGGALITAFALSILMGPSLIMRFRAWQSGGDTVKDVLPHQQKMGTPTMGGALMLFSLTVSTLLWTDLTTPYIWLLLAVALLFGAIGFTDDWLSVTKTRKGGVPGRVRLGLQLLIGAFVTSLALTFVDRPDATVLYFPFFKTLNIDLGMIGYSLFGAVVIAGAANAVNITDGLDGLVSFPAMVVAGTFAVLAYIIGRTDFTSYLGIAYVPGAGEVTVLCAALVGGLLGFLWFNAPPARIFMGDTGSLPVGALLGTVAVITKQEFTLAIVGGLFVAEIMSSVLQVISFKTTGKRIFKMAPLHHHFEQSGWAESTIVVRFWIVSLLLALIGLATLKLR